MQLQETTLIIQNPDGSIQIGSQPSKKGKCCIHCYNCKSKLVFSLHTDIIKCSNCQSMNQVSNNSISSAFRLETCSSCKIVLKVNVNAKAMKCPKCSHVTNF